MYQLLRLLRPRQLFQLLRPLRPRQLLLQHLRPLRPRQLLLQHLRLLQPLRLLLRRRQLHLLLPQCLHLRRSLLLLRSLKLKRRTFCPPSIGHLLDRRTEVSVVRLCQPLRNRCDHFIALRFREFAIDRNAEHFICHAMGNFAA